jgi:hypothetical protein
MLNSFLAGAITLASFAIATFFLHFLRATGDRLFGFFAIAFTLLGIERICIEFGSGAFQYYVYLIRLVAFGLIFVAIMDKNRGTKAGP